MTFLRQCSMPLGPGQASSGRGPGGGGSPVQLGRSRSRAVWRLALPLGLLLLVSPIVAQRRPCSRNAGIRAAPG